MINYSVWKDRLIYVDVSALVWIGVRFVTWKEVLIFCSFLVVFFTMKYLKYAYPNSFYTKKQFFYRWLHVYKNDFFYCWKSQFLRWRFWPTGLLFDKFRNHFVLINLNGFILQIMQRRIWIQRYVTKVRPQFIYTKLVSIIFNIKIWIL